MKDQTEAGAELTLHVTLKRKWFDLENHPDPAIRKDEEYREIKPYWIKRLLVDVEVKDPSISYEELAELIKSGSPDVAYGFNDFDVYQARNGYAKDAPVLRRECLGITIGKAKPEWSDNWQGDVFIIKLGNNLTNQ